MLIDFEMSLAQEKLILLINNKALTVSNTAVYYKTNQSSVTPLLCLRPPPSKIASEASS